MRPRWRSWGREAIDPHRLRPQRSGGRRRKTLLSREEWAGRGPRAIFRVGWSPRGRKSPRAPLRAGDRGAACTSWPNPPIERPDGRQRTPAGRRRWRAVGGMIKVSRDGTVAGDLASARCAHGPGAGWQGSVRRVLAAAAIAVAADQQGSGGPGALGSDRRLQRSPAGRATVLSRGETGWRCAVGPRSPCRRAFPPTRACRIQRGARRRLGQFRTTMRCAYDEGYQKVWGAGRKG